MMQEKWAEKLIPVPTVSDRAEYLPWQALSMTLTSLVGREEELAHACALLQRSDVRLLTLTGTGGVGKTRLALQVAAALRNDFPEGILFIPLASLSEPEQIIPTIAHLLGLRDSEDRSLFEHLKAFLHTKHILLLFDNFEHLHSSAPLLTALLAYCPLLKLLVTSRSVLHIQGEQEFSLLPLPLPAPRDSLTYETIAQSPAVMLFMKRAQSARYNFSLTRENAPIIAEICNCLDGLPLALELAAACTKLLPPEVLLSRLRNHLPLLTGQGQDLPTRHKTLHDTIAWSYDLLSPELQTLFRRLAIFVGGCELRAVETLYLTLSDFSLTVFDGIAQLVDKSLIQLREQEEREPRLLMLETLREFALQKLIASGELESVQQAHATYCLVLAQQAEPELYHHHQRLWLGRLEQDHENMRAALAFLQDCYDRKRLALLVGALSWFWHMHGFLTEGKQWTEQMLNLGMHDLPEPLRGKLLSAAGVFAGFLGQSEQAITRCQESLSLCKASGDVRNLSAAVYMLIHNWLALGDAAAARTLAEETLAFVRSVGDRWAIGALHCMLGSVVLYEGDTERAWQLHKQAISLFQEEGDLCMLGLILMMQADVSVAQGDEKRARALIQQGREMFYQIGASWSLGGYFSFWGVIALNGGHVHRARFLLEEAERSLQQMGDQQGLVSTYMLLALVAASERDYPQSRALAQQTIQLARLLQKKDALVTCLEELAAVLTKQGEVYWAAQLWGTIEQFSQTAEITFPPSIHERRAELLKLVRQHLGADAFASAWAEGRKMTPEQVLLVQSSPGRARISKQSAPSSSPENTESAPAIALTRRERDVLWHLAQGRTNGQIAEQLVITPTTVNSYLRTIYEKLGVTSRTGAVRYAIDHHLI